MFKTFIWALTTNLAVCCIWYTVEYQEYGQLYFRKCDNLVWLIYLCILWYLFYTKERDKNNWIHEILKICRPNKDNQSSKNNKEIEANNEHPE